jgi:DNA polymerase III delta prime subunit
MNKDLRGSFLCTSSVSLGRGIHDDFKHEKKAEKIDDDVDAKIDLTFMERYHAKVGSDLVGNDDVISQLLSIETSSASTTSTSTSKHGKMIPLFLHGPPGSGKTVGARVAASEHLKEYKSNETYYYCNASLNRTNDYVKLSLLPFLNKMCIVPEGMCKHVILDEIDGMQDSLQLNLMEIVEKLSVAKPRYQTTAVVTKSHILKKSVTMDESADTGKEEEEKEEEVEERKNEEEEEEEEQKLENKEKYPDPLSQPAKKIKMIQTKQTRFVIIANNRNKVNQTLKDVCLSLEFHPLTQNNVLQRVMVILEKEKMTNYDISGIELLSILANGDMRNAIHCLDMFSKTKERITEERVMQYMKQPHAAILQVVVFFCLLTTEQLHSLFHDPTDDTGLFDDLDPFSILHKIGIQTKIMQDKKMVSIPDNESISTKKLSRAYIEQIRFRSCLHECSQLLYNGLSCQSMIECIHDCVMCIPDLYITDMKRCDAIEMITETLVYALHGIQSHRLINGLLSRLIYL